MKVFPKRLVKGVASRKLPEKKQLRFAAALSSLVVILVFALSTRLNQFVDLDDYIYIVDNDDIARISWDTIKHTFTAFTAANWHPLTMLSLMLDRYVWGLNPAGFHLTNSLIHGVTVFCLCYLFYELLCIISPTTDESEGNDVQQGLYLVAASVAGALFFGLHPLRVESVAWASARKDVLCLFFMTASFWSYLRYATAFYGERGLKFWCSPLYLASLGLAAAALMSKPLAVTMPFLLLILDWYPLGRLADGRSRTRCLLEKLPFLLLGALDGVVTLYSQQIARETLNGISLGSRLLLAAKAVLFYLGKSIWPIALSPLYYHPGNVGTISLVQHLFFTAIVGGITVTAFLVRRGKSMWLAVWLFYLISLLPMLGVLQVGKQWVADRYSYLPAIPLSLLWGGGILWLALRFRRTGQRVGLIACLLLAAGQLAVLAFSTVSQVAVWRDTGTLTTRVIDIMPGASADPYYYRAGYRNHHGEDLLALDDINTGMKIALGQRQPELCSRLGIAKASILANLGRFPEALDAANGVTATGTSPLPDDFLQFRDDLTHRLLTPENKLPESVTDHSTRR